MATKSSRTGTDTSHGLAAKPPSGSTKATSKATDNANSKTTEKPAKVDTLASAGLKDSAEAAHYNILQVGDFLQNRLSRLLREYGLTMSQYQVLRVLDQADGALPSLEIAQRMMQLVPAITGLLTRLEDQGLVRRKQDKDDKRIMQVDLTPKARTLLKKTGKPVLDLHKQLASPLSEPELKQLSKLLEKAWIGMQNIR